SSSDFFEKLQKAFSNQLLLPLFTACDVCSSPAADAYFTDLLPAWQGIFLKNVRRCPSLLHDG
ncbi:hypothetical protein KUV41_12055, partial [Halomonas sp. DP8Y7-1]|uniref:hypothetical protein n=1 Tax=Halomonas sp. DP8Y7-1 TaxID=2859078 RepID=UPI001C968296